ncbi:hypothetical protein WJX82_002051 [Trebouxia sp. C0006]
MATRKRSPNADQGAYRQQAARQEQSQLVPESGSEWHHRAEPRQADLRRLQSVRSALEARDDLEQGCWVKADQFVQGLRKEYDSRHKHSRQAPRQDASHAGAMLTSPDHDRHPSSSDNRPAMQHHSSGHAQMLQHSQCGRRAVEEHQRKPSGLHRQPGDHAKGTTVDFDGLRGNTEGQVAAVNRRRAGGTRLDEDFLQLKRVFGSSRGSSPQRGPLLLYNRLALFDSDSSSSEDEEPSTLLERPLESPLPILSEQKVHLGGGASKPVAPQMSQASDESRTAGGDQSIPAIGHIQSDSGSSCRGA